MATRTRSAGLRPGGELLELGIGFRTRDGVKKVVKEIAEEERKTLGGERKRQQKQDEEGAKKLQRVREERICGTT